MVRRLVLGVVVPSMLSLSACGGESDGDGGGDGDVTGMSEDGTSGDSDGDASGGDGDASGGDGDASGGDGDASGGDGDASGGDGDASGGDGDPSGGDGDPSGGDGDGDGDGDGVGTAGCGLALTTGASTQTISVGGVDRNYILVVPDGYDPDIPMPLVFAWHGQGGDGALARLYYGVEEASAGAAIFVYPDGLPQASVGGDTGWDLSPTGDVDLFDALLARISDEACVDETRVFSTGHSFGGYISNALACYRGDSIRAIGEVAGGPSFWPCGGGIEVAAWLAHDPADVVVPLEQGTMARDQHLGRNGCGTQTTPVSPSPCVSYEGCDPGLPVVWCEHGQGGNGGHSWPGFAGGAIWDFFASL